MVHDYWWYVDDAAFVRQMLPGVRAVLSFFRFYQGNGGSLRRMPWWNYLDWVEGWPRGIPPATRDGFSAPFDLQLLLAYQWAAELEEALGLREMADVYRTRAGELGHGILRQYWDKRRALFADTPRHRHFSQHTNALAVLAGVADSGQTRRIAERIVTEKFLTPASIYFRYYVHQALVKAGLGDRYLEMLGPWRRMLADGLTTWAERDSPANRSDCHAWGASPNIELFRTVLGIDSAAPGFRKVLVRPHPGALTSFSGAIPHPKGEISVSLELRDGRLHAHIELPAGVDGEFDWRGRRQALATGRSSWTF